MAVVRSFQYFYSPLLRTVRVELLTSLFVFGAVITIDCVTSESLQHWLHFRHTPPGKFRQIEKCKNLVEPPVRNSDSVCTESSTNRANTVRRSDSQCYFSIYFNIFKILKSDDCKTGEIASLVENDLGSKFTFCQKVFSEVGTLALQEPLATNCSQRTTEQRRTAGKIEFTNFEFF